jgi:hypothetical protein
MSQKELFDQSNKVAFVGGKIVAFNDAVAILHPLPGDLDLEGAVDGQHLYALLNKLSSDIVNLTLENGKINLRAGRTRASFDILPVTLPIDSVDMTGEFVDLPSTFVVQLKWVSSSCARDMSRPALTCVLIENGWMQSSDSYRVSRVNYGDAVIPRLMLPIPQVEVLVDYPVTKVSLSDGGEWARFTTEEGTTLCARSMSGAYPDLATICDVQGQEVQLTSTLGPVIERARIFSRREHSIDEEISVLMRSNQITVSAQYDGGKFSEVARCEGAVDGIAFTIHPKFLSAALESGTRCVIGSRSVKFSGADWDHIVALKS